MMEMEKQKQNVINVSFDTRSLSSNKSYDVILFNDDGTPQEYVVFVLYECFDIDVVNAVQLMYKTELNGKSIVRSYATAEEAYQKLDAVNALNEQYDMLLRLEVEINDNEGE